MTVSRELTAEYGRGFSYAEIARMIQFSQLFSDAEQVELLQLDAKSIRVSEYLTELPPLPLLRTRLHQAIEHARESAARRLPDPKGRR